MEAKDFFEKASKESRKVLTIDESLQILKEYDIPVAIYGIAKNKDDAVSVAKKIGYPTVFKALSADVTHKTDVGGVVMDVDSKEESRSAFERISDNIRKEGYSIEGVFIQKSIEGGQEVMIGGKKDPQFGQTIAFGLGGIFVEVFEDVSFRVVPIERKDAEEMIEYTKGHKVLSGFRGKKYDIGSVVDVLMKVSNLLDENREISEMDINPLIVLEDGAYAVDARIVLE